MSCIIIIIIIIIIILFSSDDNFSKCIGLRIFHNRGIRTTKNSLWGRANKFFEA